MDGPGVPDRVPGERTNEQTKKLFSEGGSFEQDIPREMPGDGIFFPYDLKRCFLYELKWIYSKNSKNQFYFPPLWLEFMFASYIKLKSNTLTRQLLNKTVQR